MQNRLDKYVLLLVVLVALLFRLCVWTAYLNRTDTFVRPDTSSYLEPGMALLDDGSFPSYSRTPVYPLFLALSSKILSPDPAVIALVQIAISLITMLLMYFLCISVFRPQTALIVLAFMALDVTSMISANHLLTETLFTGILTAGLLVLIQARLLINRVQIIRFITAGILFSILSLCRPVAFLLFVPIAVWLCAYAEKISRLKIIIILCFCAFSLALPIAWTLRNHSLTGEYFFTTISAASLYEYRAAWNISRLQDRPFYEVQNEFREKAEDEKQKAGLNEGELAKWKKSQALQILKENPLMTLRQGIDGFFKMYLGISSAGINNLIDSSRQEEELKNADSIVIQRLRAIAGSHSSIWIAGIKIWALVFLILLYCGVITTASLLLAGRFSIEMRRLLWLMLIVVAYFTFFSIGAESYSRFRVPVAPALSVLSAVGWAEIINFVQRKHGISRNPFHRSRT